MPRSFESSSSSVLSTSAAVTSMSVIASHCSTIQLGDRLAGQLPEPDRKLAAVGEEERCLPFEHDDSGELGRIRVPGCAVPSSQCRNVAEDGAMGTPASVKEQQDDQNDRDDDSLEHSQEDHASRGHQADHQRGRADLSETPQGPEVHERQGGRDEPTAANAVWGRSARRPLRKRSRTATRPAPTSPVI